MSIALEAATHPGRRGHTRTNRRSPSVTGKPPHRIALVFVIAALLLTLGPAVTASAGNGHPGGGGKGSSSLSLVLMDGATEAHHYGRVTFDVSTTETDRPFVGLRCWQGSNWVYDGYVGYFPDYRFDPWFTLDSPYWAPGVAASCTARLFYHDRRGREKVLAQTSFSVAP
jgi:hypothetical protein